MIKIKSNTKKTTKILGKLKINAFFIVSSIGFNVIYQKASYRDPATGNMDCIKYNSEAKFPEVICLDEHTEVLEIENLKKFEVIIEINP